MAFIEREREADLAALLTPSELFEFEIRTSATARRLTHSLTAFDASEEEFRQLYSIWTPPFDESQLRRSVVVIPGERESSMQNLLDDSATVFSPEQVADLEQALRPRADFENATAARQLYEARVEVRGKNDAERAAEAKGDEAAAAAARLNPERGQQIWSELVENFGEDTLRSLRPVTGGKWLRTIMPAQPETGG